MNTLSMKSVWAGLMFLAITAFLSGEELVAEEGSSRTIRALVDASKDGGTWWGPQAPPDFDPNKMHQGKPAADSMRMRGWEVVELPRGTVVTSDLLKRFDVVIRPTVFFPYNESEIRAYAEAVSSGVRLLLMGSSGYDPLAEGFGLRFSPQTQIASVVKIVPLSLTVESDLLERPSSLNTARPAFKVFSIWSNEIPWVPVEEMPWDAVAFAWVEDQDHRESPVLGYFRYNEGYVLFIGSALGIYNQGQDWRNKLLEFLERNSSYDLYRSSLVAPVVIEPLGPPPPKRMAPADGEELPQPSLGRWIFMWDPVPGARNYHIIVVGARAAIPLVDRITSSTRIVFPDNPGRGGYITEFNRYNWRWRVRAQDADGRWGPWSETSTFDVAPMGRPETRR